MKSKATIAVCGLMDSGKSTLIKSLLQKNTGRQVEPDALCIEQATGRTITGTRIACPIDDQTDLVFCDCPGHMEYLPEIVSGLCASSGYILIMDEGRQEQSAAYRQKLEHIASAIGVENIAVVHSHSTGEGADGIYYDTERPSFNHAMDQLLQTIHDFLQQDRPLRDGGSNIVWFDSMDGFTRYCLYDNNGCSWDWPCEGSHDPGDCPTVTGLPSAITGRFLVCHAKKQHIAGVGYASTKRRSMK